MYSRFPKYDFLTDFLNKHSLTVSSWEMKRPSLITSDIANRRAQLFSLHSRLQSELSQRPEEESGSLECCPNEEKLRQPKSLV